LRVQGQPDIPMDDASHNIDAPLKGIALVLLAVMLFASLDTAGKHLMTKYDVPLVAAIRYGLNILLLAIFMAPRHGASLWRTRHTSHVVIRGVALALATLFAGLALQRMPVGETVAILYLQGFGVMLAAAWFLKERVSWVGWIGAAAGFAGVLLIARPGGVLDPIGVVFALACAAVSVVYVLLSRLLASTETTLAMLFHVAVAGTVLFVFLLPFHWQSYSFTPLDLALLFHMGAASLLGHFLLTSAYRFAPASILAPFNYFHIAWAALFGWIFYSHVPDSWALLGMAIIALSGAGIALHAHFSKRESAEA
jgi:drug/metabolite transporter (DMT)-like permease